MFAKLKGALFLSLSLLWAQSPLYLVYFTEKPDSLLRYPERLLSPQALQLRIERGLPIDMADVPPPSAWIDSLSRYGRVRGYSRWLNAALVELSSPHKLPAFPFVACLSPLTRSMPMGLSSITAVRPSQPSSRATAVVNSLQLDQIKLSALHSLGYTGQGIRIAILDAGFPYLDQIGAFQPLFQSGRFLGGYDFVAGDSSIFGDNAHGTQVASVIVAYDPEGIGYVGGAYGASVLLARTEDALSESRIEEWNWARAAEWADSIGVHIIQSSLGYSTFDDPNENYTYADLNGHTAITTQAARTAMRKGILVVNSAGNEGNSPWRYITAPGDADSILTVGAVGSQGQIAPFSSRGPTADGRIKPDVVALGWGTSIVGLSGQPQQASGTSFSAPLITSLAACLWQAYPSVSAQEVRQAILSSADRASAPDTLYGYGLPDGEKALRRLTVLIRPQRELSLRVYPNPAQYILHVFLSDTTFGWYDIVLADVEGRTCFTSPYRGMTEQPLAIENLRPGLYFLQVLSREGHRTFTQAFVKL